MDCNTLITKINADWVDVKNECRTTVNKEPTENEASPEFKKKLLISEHSPIRLIWVKWRWPAIKSWVATHFARHWLGWDKWIGTRRSDRTGSDRGALFQDELVPMSICANAQSLINVARFRLCHSASTETREHMEDLKCTIFEREPELSSVMVPNCIYRGGCPEFSPCGFWEAFVRVYPLVGSMNIKNRYDTYNTFFKSKRANGGINIG